MSIEDDGEIPTELGSLLYPKAFGWSNNKSIFFVHVNCSMNPTLWEKDILEVVPYNKKNDIRIGDVIVFASPIDETIIAHRVIAIFEEGICTKGDNNGAEDPWRLGAEAIFGKVVVAFRNKEHHIILGGMAGLLIAGWSNKNQKIKSKAIRHLYPVYQFALKIDLFKNCGSKFIKPKVAVFKEKGKSKMVLLSGSRVIGRYNEESGEWNINYIYRFFVSGAKFQKNNQKKNS
jgi:signal peptidase I